MPRKKNRQIRAEKVPTKQCKEKKYAQIRAKKQQQQKQLTPPYKNYAKKKKLHKFKRKNN